MLGLVSLSVPPFFGIPSPDLVLGAFASVAQILGLLTVGVLGFAGSRGRSRAAAKSPTKRWPFRVCLGLLLAVSVSFALYAAHVSDANEQRLRRNLFRPSVENGSAVGDTSLKTLGLSGQAEHPLAMTTDQVEAALTSTAGPTLRVLDVREPEEVERGAIEGAGDARYPDILADADRVADGETTLLICFSGNRSSELCDVLSARGKDVRFLVGGYEKWLAESRPLEIPPTVERGGLRDIENYPNRDTLLDTAEVTALLEQKNAVPLDVRYEDDAALSPFPKARILPIRKMTTPELSSALAELPKDQPIFVPCYDKRGSFYAAILGLRLHRLGYDFRGRYTVPHEYVVPKAERAYVAAWRAQQEGRSLLSYLAEPLGVALSAINGWLGHLGWAILALVALLRLAVYPCTRRIDRNQQIERTIAPQIAALKTRYPDDASKRARETQKLQKEHGLAPLRGLVATMVQVVVFIAFFMVVDKASTGSTQTLFGFTLGQPDGALILPALVGLLVATHVVLGGTTTKLRLAGAVIAAGVFLWLTLGLRAGVNIYLVANLALIIGQTLVTRGLRAARARADIRVRTEKRRIVPLAEAHLAPGTGKKAARLGELIAIGAPVPNGFVLTESLLFADVNGGEPTLSAQDRSHIEKLWSPLRDSVAVRSSGLNEDGEEQSYAGVFESVLNVTRTSFDKAVHEVWSSMKSERAHAYGGQSGGERGAAVVQEMVPADYSGVLFTEHPEHPTSMLIEMAEGLGEKIVSGQVTPTAHRYGRVTDTLLEGDAPPVDVAPLLEIARRVEKHFGCPQDIEWCYANGQFWLVQTRDITAMLRRQDGKRAVLAAEHHRLFGLTEDHAPSTVLLEQSALAELLPEPTPMSLALMSSLWDVHGSAHIASEQLGVPYTVDESSVPYVVSAFGGLYVNVPEGERRFGRTMSAMANFRLTRNVDGIADDFETSALPRLIERSRLEGVLDLTRLDCDEIIDLFATWRERFVEETYVEAERINIAAEFTVKTAERELSRRGLDPAEHLSHAPQTIVHQAMETLRQTDDIDQCVAMFLDVFGHRAPLDFEISAPRYAEDPSQVRMLARAADRRKSKRHAEKEAPPKTGEAIVDLALDRARRFQTLKEEAKHHCLREFALMRRALLEIAARLELGEAIFMLRPHEVSLLKQPSFRDHVLEITAKRRSELETLRAISLPTRLTVAELEQLEPGGKRERETSTGELSGVRISGRPGTRGRVRVLRSSTEMSSFQDDEILVGRFTDPTWAPLFPRARGIITEVGGWLSHAAIQAREYDITGIVGVHGALDQLETGDLVELGADGAITVLEDSRRWPRQETEAASITLCWEGRQEDAMLVNASRGGARVTVPSVDIPVGAAVEIISSGERWPGSVVNRDDDGRIGIAFALELTRRETGVLPLPKQFRR